MLKRRYFSVCASLLIFLALCFAPNVSAIEVKSYLVTENQIIRREPFLPKVVYHTYVTMPWKSGKVVVSGSPDGTAPANIGWEIQFYNTKSNTKTYSYNNSNQSFTCLDLDMPPLNITHLFFEGDNTLLVRFYMPCNRAFPSLDIGPIYLVHFDDYEPSDAPFLDLPWDYAADGERFEEVALRMSAYFDHEYPLLSTNLREPDEVSSSMVVFNDSERSQKYYSSHDGYDYAKDSGAVLNDPVLAAAPGWATYHYSKYIGNAIYIDHENGYQSRYYHMNQDDLVTKSSVKKWVNDRQQIGKVGFTGNVSPSGSKGAHIHFMVVKDKDGNGSFDDNIPDGIIDPFGWQAGEPDPWPAYTFSYNGKDRTGIRSTYLWKNSMKEGPQTIISTQTNRIINSGSSTIFDFPMKVVSHDVIFDTFAKPPITKPNINGTIQDTFASIGNIVSATVRDGFDNLITSFAKKFTLTFIFQDQDIARYDPDSLSIYSSPDGVEWKKEETTINSTKKQASAQIDHMTEFALFGEKLDTIPPVTTIEISGTKEGEYYTSPVQFILSATDEPIDTSLGVLYTGYSINDAVWTEYTEPVTIADEGEYTIEFYSEDGDGNIESSQLLAFTIDFTPPTPTSEPTQTSTPTTLPQDLLAEQTPTPTVTPTLPINTTTPTPTNTITPTHTPTAQPTPTQTPNPTSTPTSVPTTNTSTPTQKPLNTQPRVPTPIASISDDQGEVKSVFAAEAGNETMPPEDNIYPSLSLRNLFIMIMVCITAIILVWYRATRRSENST